MQSPAGFRAFQALLLEAEALYGGVQRRLAEALGIDPTRYNKLRGGDAYSLNPENCLKLAALLKRSPTEVLRAANKTALADLLDAYYGTPQLLPLATGRQGQQLTEQWARLSESQRALVLRVMEELPSAPSQVAGRAPRRRIGQADR